MRHCIMVREWRAIGYDVAQALVGLAIRSMAGSGCQSPKVETGNTWDEVTEKSVEGKISGGFGPICIEPLTF